MLHPQSLRSLHSASSLRVPTRLSSLRCDASVSRDSFDSDLRPQASLPVFLGRHRTSQTATSVQRTVSLGSIAELHSTAQQSYRNRTFSLPLAKQRHLSSPAACRHFVADTSLIASRNTSITSIEDLEELLLANEAALFIDIDQKSDLDILFPPQNSQPSRRTPIPLSYRQNNPPAPTNAHKEAVYVPLFINHDLRPRSTSSMRPDVDYCAVDENGMPLPLGRSESMEELLGADRDREGDPVVVGVGRPQVPPRPKALRRWWKGWRLLGRRVLRKASK